MKKLILTSILIFISAFAFSGTVTVNGHSCGSLITLMTTPAGDLTIKTDGTCGTVTPPVEPPVTPPSACPAGVLCVSKPFPIVQQILALRDGQTVAIKLSTDAVGTKRSLTTMITTGLSASRRVAVSTVPGEVNPANTRCATSGWESVTMNYTVGEANGLRGCFVPAGQTIYWNISPTNCPQGSRCEVYIKGN